MNHALANELKDVGYPQNIPGLYAYADNSRTNVLNGSASTYGDQPVYIPTLSELIEACRNVKGYRQFCLEDPEKGWIATMLDIENSEPLEDEYVSGGYCSTPEEAVARLWLALNKK